jgi:YD repeat-containing protein
LDVTEWNAPGTESRSYRKTEDHFDYDGFGRVRSLRQTTDKSDAIGAEVRDTKTIAYRYDQQGRVVHTWTDGNETAGGQSREYHYGTAILAFDDQGRNARTRTTTIQDGLRTERFSTSDIFHRTQYVSHSALRIHRRSRNECRYANNPRDRVVADDARTYASTFELWTLPAPRILCIDSYCDLVRNRAAPHERIPHDRRRHHHGSCHHGITYDNRSSSFIGP